MRNTVPVDEGEAEAQVPEPVVTLRVLPSTPFMRPPFDCQVEAPWLPGKQQRAALDALLHERLVRWVQQEGWVLASEPTVTWERDEDEERVRVHRFTVKGLEP